MKRKINKVGQSTLTVSLPSKWTKKVGLRQGDEVSLLEDNRSLIISTEGVKEKKKKTEIRIDTTNRYGVRSILGALYRKGYDVITINFPTEDVFKMIQSSVNTIIGFEVMEHGPKYCIIQSMLNETEEDFHKTKNKLLSVLRTVRSITYDDYISGNHNRIDEIDDYWLTGWKLRDYAMRILNKKKIFTDTTSAYSRVLWMIEKINRNYKRFYDKMIEYKAKKDDNILAYFLAVNDYFESFAQTLDHTTIEKINYVNLKCDELLIKGEKLMAKSGKQAIMVQCLYGLVLRTQDMTSSVVTVKF